MALRIDVDKGLVLLVAVPYDETIVDWIRTLPERHYRNETQDWIVPARREQLRTLCSLIGELEERGIDVKISDDACTRLARMDVGRAMLRDGVIEIGGPYSERRLPSLRALPERRFDAERKTWTVPLTRAGAMAILTLASDSDELVITQQARRALQRTAMSTPPGRRASRDVDAPPEPARRSPIAHWRHYTAGPVFDNPAHRRVDVPGVGLCVRIRVDPGRRRETARLAGAMSDRSFRSVEHRGGGA